MTGPLITPMTELFGIAHPVFLAGMNVAAGPGLAAAVTNAGGMGVLGGVGYTPAFLLSQIKELKEELNDKNAPFGIDLLIPQVGGSARKTNKDYTGGKLNELVEIVIAEKAALFVCAIGVPPKWAVDRLHEAGIPVMNMVGAPKHVRKALAVGADMICAQGTEGGGKYPFKRAHPVTRSDGRCATGHTGDVPSSVLIPACVAEAKGHMSPLTGKQVQVIAAGGIYNGMGLASALAVGASGVWVGTRFICAEEAGASKAHQDAVISAGHNDTIRSVIYTGRPLRIKKTPFIMNWENNRQDEIKDLTSRGIVPVGMEDIENRPFLMGQVCAMVNTVEPAKKIVEDMVNEAAVILKANSAFLSPSARL